MKRTSSQAIWKILTKRMLLFVLAGVVSLTWSESGRTQAAFCVIERGIDPLDVLTTGVRHNVWIGLDTSGSMQGGISGGTTKAAAARDVILQLMDELVDGSGDPLVNWGFTYFDLQFNRRKAEKCGTGDIDGDGQWENASPDLNLDGLPDSASACVGRDMIRVDPETCSDADPRDEIRSTLLDLYDGDDWVENAGGTPNGVFLDEMSMDINANYYPNLRLGQKNFVILLTDGDDTCECFFERWNDLNADVKIPSSENMLRGSDFTPDLTAPFSAWTPSCTGPIPTSSIDNNGSCNHQVDVAAYNAGLKGRASYPRIAWGVGRNIDAPGGDPDLGDPKGDIFVVGLGLGGRGKVRTNHLAWESSGIHWGQPGHPAFFADDKQGLLDAFRDIFGRIGVPEAELTLGSSVVGSVKELAHLADPLNYTPADFFDTGGDLDALRLRGIYRNNILFTTSVVTPGFRGHLKAFNIFEVQADGTRAPDFSERWDAGVNLADRQAIDRQIYFNRSVIPGTAPPTPQPFLPPSQGGTLTAVDLAVAQGDFYTLDPAGIGARTDADAVEFVVNIIRGCAFELTAPDGIGVEDFNCGAGSVGTWKLFESANATPAVVQQPPDSVNFDPPGPVTEYNQFFEDNTNRLTMVYLGSNGGMIHAFRADNGRELYGYVPSDFLPRLKDFAIRVANRNNGVLDHEYFVAASPHVMDAFLQGRPDGLLDYWYTVLTFGRGKGGKFLTALDVSTVMDWDGGPPPSASSGSVFSPPKLLFTVGNRDGVSDFDGQGENYDGFGETWSEPRIGRVDDLSAAGQWVLFAGTGYGCVGTDEGQYFYVLKLEDGTVVRKFGPIQDAVAPGDPGIDQNAIVATPALYNPHIPGSTSSDNFIDFVYVADLQGFVYRANVSNSNPNAWQFDVLFEVTSNADSGPGAGDHNQPITVAPAVLKLAGTDKILVFVGAGGDNRVQLPLGETFKFVGIEDTDAGSGLGTLITTNGGAPFFFDVPQDERVIVSPVTARNEPTNGVVFFASTSREYDAVTCGFQFTSSLFGIGATTGLGSYDMDPSQSGVQDSVTDIQGKITGLFHRDEHLYVSKSGGIGVDSGTEIRGSDEFKEPTGPGDHDVQILVDSFRVSPF